MLAVGKQTAVSKQDTIGLILPLPNYCHMFLSPLSVHPTLSDTIEGQCWRSHGALIFYTPNK